MYLTIYAIDAIEGCNISFDALAASSGALGVEVKVAALFGYVAHVANLVCVCAKRN